MDKFEPVSSGGEVDHPEEAVGQLIVTGGDGAVDLELPEHALERLVKASNKSCTFRVSLRPLSQASCAERNASAENFRCLGINGDVGLLSST